jgi:hypothetical protein
VVAVVIDGSDGDGRVVLMPLRVNVEEAERVATLVDEVLGKAWLRAVEEEKESKLGGRGVVEDYGEVLRERYREKREKKTRSSG